MQAARYVPAPFTVNCNCSAALGQRFPVLSTIDIVTKEISCLSAVIVFDPVPASVPGLPIMKEDVMRPFNIGFAIRAAVNRWVT